jgi:hypothetical protein
MSSAAVCYSSYVTIAEMDSAHGFFYATPRKTLIRDTEKSQVQSLEAAVARYFLEETGIRLLRPADLCPAEALAHFL